jgi:hypothetical protein
VTPWALVVSSVHRFCREARPPRNTALQENKGRDKGERMSCEEQGKGPKVLPQAAMHVLLYDSSVRIPCTLAGSQPGNGSKVGRMQPVHGGALQQLYMMALHHGDTSQKGTQLTMWRSRGSAAGWSDHE